MRAWTELSKLIWMVILGYVSVSWSQLIEPQIPLAGLSEALTSTTDDISPHCKAACADLSASLPDAVFRGQTGDFDFWDAKQRDLFPACRVEPESSDDITQILKIAVNYSCTFAVKSGGHERTPGASNADGGITIDLVRLKSLSVSEDKTSVIIGAGWRWEELYQALHKDKIVVLGGRIADVGVGGLLLGGGISYFSNEHGLACDSVISYEVILPNTTIITVDQHTHPQLFKALRGAPPMNFGIVSKFTLDAFPYDKQLWTGSNLLAGDEISNLLEAHHHVTTVSMQQDPHISLMTIFMCYSRHGLCYATVAAQHSNHTSETTWPPSMEAFTNLDSVPRTDQIQIASVANITATLEGRASLVRRRTIYATFTYYASVALEKRLLAIFREEALARHDEHLRKVPGFGTGLILHAFSATMLKNTRKRGGNAFSKSLFDSEYNKPPKPIVVLNIAWRWNDATDDEVVYASYRRTMARMEEAAKDMGLWHPYKYVNYAEVEQDVWAGFGVVGDGTSELERLQKQLDPQGVFASGGLAGGVWKLNGNGKGGQKRGGTVVEDIRSARESKRRDEL